MYMNLKEVRKEKGLTQQEAALIAGVSLESYKNHELGRSRIDSPLGKMIIEKIQSYERYGFEKGVLPLGMIKEIISKVFASKAIDFAIVFGSYAKGEANDHSDVDLLISGPITGLDFFSLGGELERALHKRVDIVCLEDISSNGELLSEVLKDGIRIYRKE